MPRGPEASIQDKVVKYARSRECIAMKFESPGNSGVPDYVFSHANCGPFFVEFKAPGKSSRKQQQFMQQKMADCGCLVFSDVSNVRVGMEIIDDMVSRATLRHKPVQESTW